MQVLKKIGFAEFVAKELCSISALQDLSDRTAERTTCDSAADDSSARDALAASAIMRQAAIAVLHFGVSICSDPISLSLKKQIDRDSVASSFCMAVSIRVSVTLLQSGTRS